jgi:multidrug efflux pump subunit AcrB
VVNYGAEYPFAIFIISDSPFDQGGYASFVLTGGLVCNSLMVNISTIKIGKLSKKSIQYYNKQIIKTINVRLVTILLTTFSMVCSFIPFILEGQNEVFWYSLSIGTIGGMIMSLFSTFIFLPVLLWKKSS